MTMFRRTRPCANCPFRKGLGSGYMLPPERLAEIRTASAFQCHKTVDYSGDKPGQGDRLTQCAGLMTVLHRDDRPNQIMQVGERLGALNPADLDKHGEAYDTWAQVLAAHTKGEEP